MSKMYKVYIGNLENGVTLEQLKVLLAPFTDLEDLVLVTDPETGESRCFAVAMFRDPTRGQLVIETLNGKMLSGRPLVLNEVAKKRKGLPPKKEMKRPGQGFGGSRAPSGGDAGPRGPARVPSGRPSSRPFGRGNARRDGSSAPGSTGGQGGGFSRGSQSPSDSRGLSRPGGSAGFSRPTTPRAEGFRPPAHQAHPSVPAVTAPQPARPATPMAPKPPVDRRSDAADEESPKGT